MEERKTIGQMAWQTKVLLDLFLDTEPGSVVTYGTLKSVLKEDPQGKARGYIASARRILRRQHSVVLACNPTIGYSVVTGTSAMGEAIVDRRSARRKAIVAEEVLNCVQYESLSQADQLKWNGEKLQSAMIQHAASDRIGRVLAGKTDSKTRQLSGKIEADEIKAAFDSVKELVRSR